MYAICYRTVPLPGNGIDRQRGVAHSSIRPFIHSLTVRDGPDRDSGGCCSALSMGALPACHRTGTFTRLEDRPKPCSCHNTSCRPLRQPAPEHCHKFGAHRPHAAIRLGASSFRGLPNKGTHRRNGIDAGRPGSRVVYTQLADSCLIQKSPRASLVSSLPILGVLYKHHGMV